MAKKGIKQQRPVEIRPAIKPGNVALVEELLARGLVRLMAKEELNAVQSSQTTTKAA